MTAIFCVRHGESGWNKRKVLSGRSDVPLTDKGREQTTLLGKRLHDHQFSMIYTSPLSRALETAEIITNSLIYTPSVSIDDRLIEIDCGDWEGKRMEEIVQTNSYKEWDEDPSNNTPPNGEKLNDVITRITSFLEFAISNHTNESIMLVGHKTTCRLMMCYILGIQLGDYKRKINQENASLSIIEHANNNWNLVLLNDTSHLEEQNIPPLFSEEIF